MRATKVRPVTVTLAEIARISGVGRAAVSNWRRRHNDFPSPVGGSDTSPQFELARARDWLGANGKLGRSTELDWLWPHFEALGGMETIGTAIARFGRATLDYTSPDQFHDAHDLSPVINEALRVAAGFGAQETFAFLHRRFLESHVRQITTTPGPLSALMADIAAVSRGGGGTKTILDPACGTGELLITAATRWADQHGSPVDFQILGQDSAVVLTELASTRILLSSYPHSEGTPSVRVKPGNSLLNDRQSGLEADVILCHPPSNEREWGHEKLSTDPRWIFGLPPRTEPELAWVQHCVAHLAPGGTAVLLLPPLVASRRAGRRIRSGLVRSGILRAIIALPPGCASPHSLSLHLWVLNIPDGNRLPDNDVLFIDSAALLPQPEADTIGSGRFEVDWDHLRSQILPAIAEKSKTRRLASRVAAIDLLDEHVDLTPARRVPTSESITATTLLRSWTRLRTMISEIQALSEELAKIEPDEAAVGPGSLTLEDLIQSKSVSLRSGQLPPNDIVSTHPFPGGKAIPLCTIADLSSHNTTLRWVDATSLRSSVVQKALTLTVPDDVVLSGSSRWFDSWVDTEAPTAIGNQLFVITPGPDVDPWFLAGCLRSPRNARLADTHTSSVHSRVDIRHLTLPRLPLVEQQEYGQLFRRLRALQSSISEIGDIGEILNRGLHDLLTAGAIRVPRC